MTTTQERGQWGGQRAGSGAVSLTLLDHVRRGTSTTGALPTAPAGAARRSVRPVPRSRRPAGQADERLDQRSGGLPQRGLRQLGQLVRQAAGADCGQDVPAAVRADAAISDVPLERVRAGVGRDCGVQDCLGVLTRRARMRTTTRLWSGRLWSSSAQRGAPATTCTRAWCSTTWRAAGGSHRRC